MDQAQDLDRLFSTGHWQSDESLFNRPGAMGLVLGGGGGLALTSLYGLLYDDRENAKSYTMPGGSCQLRVMLNGTSVRTVPRFDALIPAGRTGWMKISSASDEGIVGAMINYNPSNGFNQGHLLHVLSTTRSAVIKVPLMAPVLN